MYQIKYMSKECVAIAAVASVLVEAYNHNKKYASTAEDAGTQDRWGKYFCQRAINHSTMELEGVQAASLITTLRSSGSSDSIHYFSGWDVERLARIAARGVIDDVNFGNEVLDDDPSHESDDSSDNEIAEMQRGIITDLSDSTTATPAIDLLNISHHVPDVGFNGYAQVFRNSVNENVPVSQAHHYMYRDLLLWRFSAYEFVRLFTLRSMTKEDRKWYDAVTATQPQESAAIRCGRLCYRFLLMPPHPLPKSHVLVPRTKLGVPAFAGAPPPSDAPSLHSNSTITRKRKRFASFFVSNFVPWSIAQPPDLRYSAWSNHLNTMQREACRGIEREPDMTDNMCQDDKDAISSAKRSRLIAHGRLYDNDNITKCFKVKRPAVVVLAKHRARARTIWSANGHNKPAGDAPAEMHRAANAIRKLQAKADRIRGDDDLPSRLHKAANATKWANDLRNALSHNRFQAKYPSDAPQRLQSIWKKAAFPSKRSLKGGIRNPRDFASKLKKPIVLTDSNEWNTGTLSVPNIGDSNLSLDANTDGIDLFAEISAVAYERAAAEHKASGLPNADAPLNPEQRACGRDIIRVAMLTKELKAQGLSASAITSAIKRLGISQITMMHGKDHVAP